MEVTIMFPLQSNLTHRPAAAALLATLATSVAVGVQAPAHATFIGITGVTGVSAPASAEELGSIAGGNSPTTAQNDDGVFDTLTVGSGSVSASALITGTSTFLASAVTSSNNDFARTIVDDLDIFNGVSSGGGGVAIWGGSFETTGFGGAELITANTDPAGLPDFYVIEAVFIPNSTGPGTGGVDTSQVQAVLADGSLGVAVDVPNLGFGDGGDLGVNLATSNLNTTPTTVNAPGQGEFDIGGFAFSIEDLLDDNGDPLTATTAIRGIRVLSSGIDPLSVSANVTPIPEPNSLALLGLSGFCFLKRRRQRA